MHTQNLIVEPNKFYIPNKKIITERKLLRRIIRGDEYSYQKEREFNADKGKRGYQIKLFGPNFIWNHNLYLKRFCFENESDVIDFHIEINEPGFDWGYYDINYEDVDKVLLLITQALTSGAGSTQQFSVPVTWGPNNTCYAIGGGGNGGDGAIFNNGTARPTANGGGGGGGGALSASAVNGLTRNGLANYFIGSANSFTWFKDTSTLVAFGGLNGTTGHAVNVISQGGSGGQASSGIGTFKVSGGDGARGGAASSASGSDNYDGGGGGGGGAGGAGSGGTSGTLGISNVNGNVNGGNGGASDTASGVAGTIGDGTNGNIGTDFDGSHGAGSGASGGGCDDRTSTGNGAVGGLYGGGGSGGASQGPVTSVQRAGSIGAQGMIWLSWVPYVYSEFYSAGS